jgi:hypothetical protein
MYPLLSKRLAHHHKVIESIDNLLTVCYSHPSGINISFLMFSVPAIRVELSGSNVVDGFPHTKH